MQVVYVTSSSFVDKAIRFFDGGEFSHCAMIFDNWVIQAVRTNVEQRTLNELLNTCTKNFHIDIQLPDEAAAYAWARTQLGRPYDFWAIAMLAIRDLFGSSPHWGPSGRYFCDELVLEACISGGMPAPEDHGSRFYGISKSLKYLQAYSNSRKPAGSV
jgi:hypothetical protein